MHTHTLHHLSQGGLGVGGGGERHWQRRRPYMRNDAHINNATRQYIVAR